MARTEWSPHHPAAHLPVFCMHITNSEFVNWKQKSFSNFENCWKKNVWTWSTRFWAALTVAMELPRIFRKDSFFPNLNYGRFKSKIMFSHFSIQSSNKKSKLEISKIMFSAFWELGIFLADLVDGANRREIVDVASRQSRRSCRC